MSQIYVDMDGVLADFDRHYEDMIGPLPDRNDPNREVDWTKIKEDEFFAGIPPMEDMRTLWKHVAPHYPIILTGCPTNGREQAEKNKRDWVERHIGKHVPVLTVLSKEKSIHCSPGDILIDDWEKYKPLWVQKGGIWITHKSAACTITQLKLLGI